MIRERLELWERWLRSHIGRARTRRIEDERLRYLHNYNDIHAYLEKLNSANAHNTQTIEELKKRMGL